MVHIYFYDVDLKIYETLSLHFPSTDDCDDSHLSVLVQHVLDALISMKYIFGLSAPDVLVKFEHDVDGDPMYRVIFQSDDVMKALWFADLVRTAFLYGGFLSK